MTPDGLTQAVIAQLSTGDRLIYDGEPRPATGGYDPAFTPPVPYWCVYGTGGAAYVDRYDGTSGDLVWTVSVVCVSNSPRGARDAATVARELLVDYRPDLSAGPLREQVAGPVIVDHSVPSRPLWSVTVEFRTTATRSPT